MAEKPYANILSPTENCISKLLGFSALLSLFLQKKPAVSKGSPSLKHICIKLKISIIFVLPDAFAP